MQSSLCGLVVPKRDYHCAPIGHHCRSPAYSAPGALPRPLQEPQVRAAVLHAVELRAKDDAGGAVVWWPVLVVLLPAANAQAQQHSKGRLLLSGDHLRLLGTVWQTWPQLTLPSFTLSPPETHPAHLRSTVWQGDNHSMILCATRPWGPGARTMIEPLDQAYLPCSMSHFVCLPLLLAAAWAKTEQLPCGPLFPPSSLKSSSSSNISQKESRMFKKNRQTDLTL